jgi:ankyrin repeat protein
MRKLFSLCVNILLLLCGVSSCRNNALPMQAGKCDQETIPPLYSAIVENNTARITQLLNQPSIDLNQQDSTGKSPLYVAVALDNAILAQQLIEAEANLELRGPRGRTPLHEAVANANRTIVQQLVNGGANLEAKDCDGRTPLLLALVLKH